MYFDEQKIERLLATYFTESELEALYARLGLEPAEQAAMKEFLGSWRRAGRGIREQVVEIQLMASRVDDVSKVVWAASVVAEELAKRSRDPNQPPSS